MDPFTKKILDRAEQRSRQLGISDPSKFPISSVRETSTDTGFGESTASPKDRSKDNKNVVRFSSKKANEDPGQFDNISVEINITTDSSVGVKCDVISMDVDEDGNVVKKQELINEEGKSLRDVSRNRLQRLGALYSNTENLSSPIHRTEAKFCEEASSSSGSSSRITERDTSRTIKSSKLAALADTINTWECDAEAPKAKPMPSTSARLNRTPTKVTTANQFIRTPTKAATPSTSTSSSNPRTPTRAATGAIPKTPDRTPKIIDTQTKGAIKKSTTTASSGTGTSPKPKSLKWDKSVMDALELQGFQKRQSESGRVTLTYGGKGKEPDSSSDREKENRMNETVNNKKMALGLNRDNAVKYSPKKLNLATTPVLVRHSMAHRKDPAELPLRERLAIFEKNKGEAVLPKAPLAHAIPANKANPVNNLSSAGSSARTPEKKQIPIPVNLPKATSDAQGMGIQSTISALLQGGATISGQAIQENTKKQRNEEMGVLLNRFNRKASEEEMKIPAPPPPPPPSSTNYMTNKRRSGENKPGVQHDREEPKRPKTSQEGRLYPTLSDVDDTSSSEQNYTTATVSEDNNKDDGEFYDYSSDESDDEHCQTTETSVSRKVLDSINKSNRERNLAAQEAMTTSSDEESDGMDDYLDEALENNNTSTEDARDKNRRSVSSNSFSYSRSGGLEKKRRSSQHRNPVESKMTLHEDENEVKLIHTVSFYRRQQSANTPSGNAQKARPRVKQDDPYVTDDYEEEQEMESGSVRDDPAATQRKIKQLLDEVCKQQQIIGQTSQALNLCASTVEFSGSTESVEGERHLLVATHRRQAALNEIQRLRVEGLSSGRAEGAERGKITITDITLPLRQDYIRKLAADTISGHHLVCLVKYGEHVFATRTVPTLPGLLTVKFPDTIALPEVYADFKITLEIYGMTAQREVLPHDIKYHIASASSNGKKKLLLTPRAKKNGHDSNLLVMPPVQSPGGPNAVRTPGLVHYGFVIFSMREVKRTNWTLNTVTSTSPLDGTVHMKIDCELSITVTHSGFLTMFEEVSGFGAWHRRWCRLQGQLLSFWKYPDDERKKAPIGTIDLANCRGQVVVAPRDICARLNTLMLEVKEDGERSRLLLSSDTKEEREMWKAQLNKSIVLMNSWSSSSK